MDTKNFGITEEELNASNFESPDIENDDIDDIRSCEQLNLKEIDLDPCSINFFIRSLFCGNSSAVYMSYFINLIQGLSSSTLGDPITYNTHSHVITLYILKMLEKNGIVKVTEYKVTHEKNKYVNSIFDTKKSKITMYNISFYKVRNIREEDAALLKKVENTLQINDGQLKFKNHNGSLRVTLGALEICKSIFTGHLFIQLKKNVSSWRKHEGFKEELDNVLYNVARSRHSVIKQ